jgi:hypothetical protein
VGGGGNEVTFLNIILQLFLPHVADTLQRTAELAFREAQWQAAGYPSPGTLGLRTTEYLSYSGFKCLGEHADSGSIYTILFAIAHPKEVSGFLIVQKAILTVSGTHSISFLADSIKVESTSLTTPTDTNTISSPDSIQQLSF